MGSTHRASSPGARSHSHRFQDSVPGLRTTPVTRPLTANKLHWHADIERWFGRARLARSRFSTPQGERLAGREAVWTEYYYPAVQWMTISPPRNCARSASSSRGLVTSVATPLAARWFPLGRPISHLGSPVGWRCPCPSTTRTKPRPSKSKEPFENDKPALQCAVVVVCWFRGAGWGLGQGLLARHRLFRVHVVGPFGSGGNAGSCDGGCL